MGSTTSTGDALLPHATLPANAEHSRFVQRVRRRYGHELALLPAGVPDRATIIAVVERLLGEGASLVAAARLLFRMPTFRVTLRVEGEASDRNYVTPLVFIGVGERELRLPTLGARVPGGKRGLHVMVVRRRSGARALAAGLAAAARGVKAVARTPAMDAFLVECCRIEPRRTRLSVDGELVSLTPPFEYRHVPAHLLVVVSAGKNAPPLASP